MSSLGLQSELAQLLCQAGDLVRERDYWRSEAHKNSDDACELHNETIVLERARDAARAVACALAARIREYAHLHLTDLQKELMFAEDENDWLREGGRR